MAPLTVAEFVEETREDIKSPTTSSFSTLMPECRTTITCLEESLDMDRECLMKMKKAVKAMCNSGEAHVSDELSLSRVLERVGSREMSQEKDADVGSAFIKFSVITKELANHTKALSIRFGALAAAQERFAVRRRRVGVATGEQGLGWIRIQWCVERSTDHKKYLEVDSGEAHHPMSPSDSFKEFLQKLHVVQVVDLRKEESGENWLQKEEI
ncbi:unnamed protein product [Cyprideis torosa]|uniref:Uncharacterized protein n=1 Tax=Cyprideis torosa TaxID=163714 RepID=A0A7R8ZLX4_9CRUS|nr:unnamed protein product [Cyprideis torosa]CAG0892861.1 unnamed protein product [Cyprideis torosa]